MWPITLSGRLPVDALVGHYPTNKLIGRELIPYRKKLSTTPPTAQSYPVLDPVSQAYPEVQGRSPTCYSPVRHSSTPQKQGLSVRLACVKHAASVRPEPGSNSPQRKFNQKNQAQSLTPDTQKILTKINSKDEQKMHPKAVSTSQHPKTGQPAHTHHTPQTNKSAQQTTTTTRHTKSTSTHYRVLTQHESAITPAQTPV